MIRATLDSLAYQVCDVLSTMSADAGAPVGSLRVDGGASANDYLMQRQADLADVPVYRPACVETTAMGAAFLAGLAVGFYESKEAVKKLVTISHVVRPQIDPAVRKEDLRGWARAVRAACAWADDKA